MAFGEIKMLHTLTLSPVGIRFGRALLTAKEINLKRTVFEQTGG